MTANDEQRKWILGMLKEQEIYCENALNFDKETEGGYEDYDDRIYIDGNITFDTMAQIVDYLRKDDFVSIPKSEYERLKELETRMDILMQSNQILRETFVHGLNLLNGNNNK